MNSPEANILATIEEVTRPLSSIDPRERRSECGRLILTADALHYVQGWEVHTTVSGGGGALGALADLASRSPDGVDTRGEGRRMLERVKGMKPADQVLTVSGSVSIPRSDIESASLGFFTSVLSIVTEARGESYDFAIERRHRGPVKTWLATLPRR